MSDSQITVASLPGSTMRLLGALQGIPVIESKHLRYDEMFIGSGSQQGVVVGEARHFLYRMKMIDLNNAARDAARAHIEATATRILGEPWEVSPR